MHTQHPGIETTWTQEIGLHFFRVFIWKDKESMWEAFDQVRYPYEIPDTAHDYYGRCVTFPKALSKISGDWRAGKKYAEVHLRIEQIGAGYVAHELQHLLHYWSEFVGVSGSSKSGDEELAELCEKLTTQFWQAFYERYDERFQTEIDRKF